PTAPANNTITTPWLTALTNGNTVPGHTLAVSDFYEGGIDLTAQTPSLAGKCFSSFLGDTRSSQSLTATIFDFASGGFEKCGANIQITPNGVNEINTPHTFTVHINATNAGVSQNAPDGTHATVTLKDENNNTVTPTSDTCQASGAGPVNGDCTVTVNSTTAKVITATASTTFTFNGSTLSASTDGVAPNSGPAVKRYVDANVSITPSGVNEVNHAHTFTISTTAIPSGTTRCVTSLTVTVTPSPDSKSPCPPTGSGNTRTCTVVINSATHNTFTANATASWHFVDPDTPATPPSVNVSRTTDSTHGSSGPATKKFVDANVSITPSGVNEVNHAHTFTISSTAFSEGTTATITSLTPSVSPSTTLLSNNCGTPTQVGNVASCTFAINSTTHNTFTANAQAVWGFSGSGTPSSATVTRDTD